MPGVSPKPRPGSLLPHETRGDGCRSTQVGKGGPFEMRAGRSDLGGLLPKLCKGLAERSMRSSGMLRNSGIDRMCGWRDDAPGEGIGI